MSEWRPIETAQENQRILVFVPYNDHSIVVDSFRWRETYNETVESESHNAKGRRRIIQEELVRDREWGDEGWGATHWMPLPTPPASEKE